MIIVPAHLPGIELVRPMGVFGHLGDHAEVGKAIL
jgi:hypothetical protein